MTVYIVQRLHWEYDDVFYLLDSEQPVKAFVKKESAEAYRQALEDEAKKNWKKHYGIGHRDFVSEHGIEHIPQTLYEVVPVELTNAEESDASS
jgi:ATP-dependent helicase/DNAse subunit B